MRKDPNFLSHHPSSQTAQQIWRALFIAQPHVHRALRVRASKHGHSMEAEVREILESAVAPEGRVKLGSLLADIGRQAELTDEEFAILQQTRDKTPSHPVNFE